MGVPKANVTGIIERLVRQGLLRREQDLQDRRSHALRLTEKGRGEIERLREWSIGRLERALENVPEEEFSALIRSLEVMLTAAQQMSGASGESDTRDAALTAQNNRL